jgi:hypothetical protein
MKASVAALLSAASVRAFLTGLQTPRCGCGQALLQKSRGAHHAVMMSSIEEAAAVSASSVAIEDSDEPADESAAAAPKERRQRENLQAAGGWAAPQAEIDRRRNFAIISHPDAGKVSILTIFTLLMRLCCRTREWLNCWNAFMQKAVLIDINDHR